MAGLVAPELEEYHRQGNANRQRQATLELLRALQSVGKILKITHIPDAVKDNQTIASQPTTFKTLDISPSRS